MRTDDAVLRGNRHFCRLQRCGQPLLSGIGVGRYLLSMIGFVSILVFIKPERSLWYASGARVRLLRFPGPAIRRTTR